MSLENHQLILANLFEEKCLQMAEKETNKAEDCELNCKDYVLTNIQLDTF